MEFKMSDSKIDWSKYEVKNDDSDKIDWSQFEVKDNESKLVPTPFNEKNGNSDLKDAHPLIYSLAEKLAKHPDLAKGVENLANSPVSEAALSAGPALINAFKNMANLAPVKLKENGLGVERRTVNDKPLYEQTKRGFPEPKNLKGKIASIVGSILGAGTAMVAVPGSGTIGGGLATGFAQGEGGMGKRSLDAMIGLLLPGILHGAKFGKDVLKSKEINKNINALERQKAGAESNVVENKLNLADTISKELEPVIQKKSELADSLNKLAGESESASKEAISSSLKNAESKIDKKYKGLYEGFNASEAGQRKISEPVKIENLENDYGLKESDFSNESKSLINKVIGKSKEIPQSEHIDYGTGKPLNEASTKFTNIKNPKVSDYINLWKQLRAEVGELRYSMKSAATPESKAAFRNKANQLEKLSDDINRKAIGTLSEKEAANYAAIQKGYLKERVPFLEENILKNATGKQPKVPDNFFEKLNGSGIGDLLKSFKSEHPELVDAITKHDIRGLSELGSKELNKLIKGDFGRFINTNTRNQLSSLHGHKEAEDLLKKALGKVQTTEVGRKVRSSDIKDIVAKKPELAGGFENIANEQKKVRIFKKQLVDEGFNKEAVSEALSKYKSAVSAAKTAGVPIGAYLGLVKSKAGSSSDNEY